MIRAPDRTVARPERAPLLALNVPRTSGAAGGPDRFFFLRSVVWAGHELVWLINSPDMQREAINSL